MCVPPHLAGGPGLGPAGTACSMLQLLPQAPQRAPVPQTTLLPQGTLQDAAVLAVLSLEPYRVHVGWTRGGVLTSPWWTCARLALACYSSHT